MIGNWEVARVALPDRFFEYSRAYLHAAMDVCSSMGGDEARRNWPNASVAMLLAVHAVELFLKGAILSRSPSADIKTHNLSDLWRLYRDTLPGDEFEFDMPFQSEYIGFTEEEAAALAKDEPLPSIMHRYPVNKDLLPWAGIQCFEAPPFRAMLERLLETFDGVWGKVRGV